MKVESLNLHGLSLEEALNKVEINIKWCINNEVQVLDINHGKGFHSNRGFSVIKQEIRKLVKDNAFVKDSGYIVVSGESNLPVALTFDEGHTLLVQKGYEKQYIGGKKQVEKNFRVFSDEGKKHRKIAKKINSQKRKK